MATKFMIGFENPTLELISYLLLKHQAPKINVRNANETCSEIDQSGRHWFGFEYFTVRSNHKPLNFWHMPGNLSGKPSITNPYCQTPLQDQRQRS
jgi:hypothetical protein